MARYPRRYGTINSVTDKENKMKKKWIKITYVILNAALAFQPYLFAGLAIGTPILTPTGPVPIEILNVDDSLTGYNPHDGSHPRATIQAITIAHADVYNITTDQTIIHTSANQAFYDVMRDQYIEAQFFEPGDCLLTHDLKMVHCTKIEHGPPTILYDITLDHPHLFFCSDAGILTHNFIAAVPALIPALEALATWGTAVALVHLTKKSQTLPNPEQTKNQVIKEAQAFAAQYYDHNKPMRINHARKSVNFSPNPPALASILPDADLYHDMLTFPSRYGPLLLTGTMTETGDVQCTLLVLAFDGWGSDRHPVLVWKELGAQTLPRSDPLVKAFIDAEDKKLFDELQQFIKKTSTTAINAILSKNCWIIDEDKQLRSCGSSDWHFFDYTFGTRAVRAMVNKKISPWTVINTISCGNKKPAIDQNLIICSHPKNNVAVVIEKCSHKILNVGILKSDITNLDKPDETPSDIDTLDANKIKHIIEGSKKNDHLWDKLVPDKNWEDIKKIMKEVLRTGVQENHKRVWKKVARIQNVIVEVTYNIENNIRKIGDGWIKFK